MLRVLLLGILSLLARAAAPGRRLERGWAPRVWSLREAGIPEERRGIRDRGEGTTPRLSLEQPSPVPLTHLPDWKVTGGPVESGRVQQVGLSTGATAGRSWGRGQLPQALGPALDLTPEHPHPVWNHRDHLEHLGRQKGQSGLRRIGISGLVPSPWNDTHLHSHSLLWLPALGPAVSSSHGRASLPGGQ